MAIASVATVRGVFGSDTIGYCVTNVASVVFDESMLSGGDAVFVYTSTASEFTFNVSSDVRAWILAVGGGGAGGTGRAVDTSRGQGGGGGGGGFVETNGLRLTSGAYTIGVGVGGQSKALAGDNGGDSFVRLVSTDLFRAKGGGGGVRAGASAGKSGSSGGGGSLGNGGAAEAGQGYVGGNGEYYGGGGGGGGAGGEGGNTPEAQKGGSGGKGRESTITGVSVFYAGGGGGGASDATYALGGKGGGGAGGSSTRAPVVGDDGFGGGGGGGGNASLSADRNGAKGGSGVVIIRVSKVYGEVPYPEIRDYEYTGQPITVWDGDDECTVTGDALSQTAIGEYSFTVKPISPSTWKGGSSDETNYVWHIVKSSNYLRIIQDGGVEGSVAETRCEYKVTDDSNEPTVIYSNDENGTYTDVMPTAPGVYWVKASIAETSNYDGAIAGPQPFRILGSDETPIAEKPLKYFSKIVVVEEISETGRVTVAVAKTHDWIADYNDGTDVRFCDAMGNLLPSRLESWNVDGSATFSVDVPPMRAGAVFYMCWGEVVGYSVPDVAEPSATAISVATTVGESNSDPSRQLKNWIRDLSMSGWRAGVDSPSVPTCTAKIGIGTVQYKYAITGLTPSLVYDPANPPEPGIYDLQAVIDWTGDYDRASSEKVTFRVLREKESPLEALAYFAKITATGSQAEARSVTVTLPSTLDYRTMFNDGSDIRFCDANGSIMNSRLDGAWATNGSAKFKVELPAFSSSFGFYMCWGPVTGVDVPATGTPTTTAATGISLSAIGTAVRDTDKPALVNHWVTEPVFPDAWSTDDTPTYTPGDPAYPASGYEFKFICRSMMTGDEVVTNELPTVGGDYQLIAFVDAGDFADGGSWAGITNEPWEVSISTRTPSISVTRYNGAEGRVLLMNDDVAAGYEITNQGYFATNTTLSTYWEHSNVISPPAAIRLQRNLSNETDHVLWTADGKRLWTLKKCRIGNVFTKSDGTSAAQNYLPIGSDTTLDFNGSGLHTRHGTGHAVMMNTTDACIISSCYDDGIGTLYFDAVNGGSAIDKEFFRLKIYVATDCKTSLGDVLPDVIPADEYVREFDEEPPAVDVVTTNANWRLVEVLPFKVENGVIAGASDSVVRTNVNGVVVSVPASVANVITNEVALDVTKGNTTDWYYRIVVPIDITGPARFKMERVSSASGGLDIINNYIPIDNIIASYPAMRASITTYGEGEYDSNKTGKDVIGVPNALTEAFPSPSSTNLFGRGKVSYITNAGVENPATNTFITSARFNYRWRYLNQLFYHDGETKTSDDGVFASGRLSAADGYLTTRPLDLPGLNGDIEYWYDLMLAAPYYEYHDYSGLDAGVGCYSENITNYIGRADATYRNLPSMGTDWFVRVREGESAYEGVRLVVKDSSVTPAATEDVGMSLVGDHLWRGFVAVTNSTERKLTIEHIRVVNRQEDGSAEYAINFEDFRSTVSNINISTRPFNGKMVVVGTAESFIASVEYLTNVASYIEFQFNDRTGAISISHADYQDFDTWFTSRRTTDDKFYSSRYVTNSTSIARHRYPASKDVKAVAGFAETPLTDNAWTENFRLTGTQTLSTNGFWIGKGFSSAKTPKGWDAEQGMWVAQRWGITNSTDFALQMEGCCKGSVTFDLTPAPNGLDTISFKTRLAQFSEYNDIAWCWSEITRTNYMFAAQACFDEDSKFSNFSGEGSVSLFAGYVPYVGAYEYRITVYNVDAGGSACCRHAIYRWKVQGGKLVAEPLLDIRGDQIGWAYGSDTKTEDRVKKMALGKDGNNYSGIYISFDYDKLLNAVTIIAGVTMADASGSNKQARNANFMYSGLKFYQIAVVDTDPVTKMGTYGVLSKNCPARIYYPRVHFDQAMQIPATGTTN